LDATELIIPKVILSERIDEPPYDKKGRVIPVTGTKPIFMPILTKDWNVKREAEERQKRVATESLVVWVM
jgi:hypothetical protein